MYRNQYAFLRNDKYRPALELLCGLVAQAFVFVLASSVMRFLAEDGIPETRDVLLGFSAIGAVICVGPQVAFVLRRGDTGEKLCAGATYVAFGVAVCGALLALGFLTAGVLQSWRP